MKKVLKKSLLGLGVVACVAGSHPCDIHPSGDWCHETGYVSCPYQGLRPCPSGLVCQQSSPGVVYCVRPEERAAFLASLALVPPSVDATPDSTPLPPSNPQPFAQVTTTYNNNNIPSTPAITSTYNTPLATPSSVAIAPMSASWPNGPIKAIYINNHCWDSTFSFNTLVDAGYNLIILAFFINKAPFDCAIAWERLTPDQQVEAINYAHSHGAKIIVSAGGATESPYASSTGISYGEAVATWAVRNNLDGVDFDLENFGREFTFGALSTAAMVQWVADATNAARRVLGSDRVIAHAPQPPYFGNNGWADGYGKVYALAPSIDYFLVQYYNNGPTTTYETIFLSNNQGASVTQIASSGIPMNKIVIGKPVQPNDIENIKEGYNTAQELNAIFTRAQRETGWAAGVMGWQWHDLATNRAWITSIYP